MLLSRLVPTFYLKLQWRTGHRECCWCRSERIHRLLSSGVCHQRLWQGALEQSCQAADGAGGSLSTPEAEVHR